MVDGPEHGVGHRHDRLLVPAMVHHAAILGRQDTVLGLDGPKAASMSAIRSHRLPFRVFPDLCLPALSWLPGHIPAQLARCQSLGKRLMSAPTSASITSAVRRTIPWTVSSCV